MAERIELAGNSDYVHMCFRCLAEKTPVPENYDDVPLRVLFPAFMLSELKTVFLCGCQVFLAPLAFIVLPWSICKWLRRGQHSNGCDSAKRI